MRLKEYFISGKNKLLELYGKEEADALCLRILNDLYGITRESLILHGADDCTLDGFQTAIDKLLDHVPCQHITGYQDFLGRRFKVSPDVLIPRPETEELVSRTLSKAGSRCRVLDIGTGSGAIAVSMALAGHEVTAVDISAEALAIAEKNAGALGADVEFIRMNFLDNDFNGRKWDVIISNPPYIPIGTEPELPKNVSLHEPHEALFVPDDNPLVFYKAISEYAFRNLTSGGLLALEIHSPLADKTAETVRNAGFDDVQMEKDFRGLDRFIWCTRQ